MSKKIKPQKSSLPKKDKLKDKLKLMFSSNSMWSSSGYGQQMADILPSLRKMDCELSVVNFYGLEGGEFELDGIKQFPKLKAVYGEDSVLYHQGKANPDYVITLQDIWVLDQNALVKYKNWIPMIPVDHDPIPQNTLNRLRAAYRVIAISRFGEKQCKDNGINAEYIPHTVDTSVFIPKDKKTCRDAIGVEQGIFLFGMIAANKDNPSRKSFQEVMDAFKLFSEKHEEARLYFHSDTENPHGFPIKEYSKTIGIDSKIIYTHPSLVLTQFNKADVATIINSFDCLLSPSSNEGFGVPIIEAQACGVPVIVNNFTSMPELIKEGETGYACKINYKRYTPMLSFVAAPDVQDLYEKMELIYLNGKDMKDKCVKNAKNYDKQHVFKTYWQPFLEKLRKEKAGREAPEAINIISA